MAGKKTRDVIACFIIEREYKRFAELGVAEGKLLRSLLENKEVCRILKCYYAIDLWKGYHDISDEVWEQYYREICLLSKRHVQLVVIRQDVTEIAKDIIDGSLDMVFIDADHSYEAVRNDIYTWLPKIRRGGLLLGHDYNHGNVRKAVDGIFDSVDITCAAPTWAFEVSWSYFYKIKDTDLRERMLANRSGWKRHNG